MYGKSVPETAGYRIQAMNDTCKTLALEIQELAAPSIKDSIVTALILFIDNPEHASLEPALAAAVPPDSTPRIYDALLTRLRNLTALFAGEKYLYYSHYPNWNDAWDINVYRKRLQSGDSLSGRIRHAIDDTRDDEPGAILWMSPAAAALDASHLQQAIDRLADCDLVIGADPAGRILLLAFGGRAFEIGIPENLNANIMAETAAGAGLSAIRLELPAAPQSPEDLRRLQIALD